MPTIHLGGGWAVARGAQDPVIPAPQNNCVDPMPTTAREQSIVSPHRCRYKDCFLIWRRQRGGSQARGRLWRALFASATLLLCHIGRLRDVDQNSWASVAAKGKIARPRIQARFDKDHWFDNPGGVENLRPRVVKPSRRNRSGEKSGGRKW